MKAFCSVVVFFVAANAYNPLLCGRPIGRITRLARSSVCPSVPYGLVTRKKQKSTNQNWYKSSPGHE